jgi:hypothetical protein
MSFWSIKSQQNETAAQLLRDNGLYASSIHCSYYRCIQLMVHLLVNKNYITKEELDESTDGGKSSHNFLISKIALTLYKKNQNTKANDFKRTITSLRLNRTDADYKNLEITGEISEESQKSSALVCGIISSTL